MEEVWKTVVEFPRYQISSFGRIYNTKDDSFMKVSRTTFGHTKITLTSEDGTRHTRSVALLVACAFVEPPNHMCDQVIFLDGDLNNVVADNLMWRPRWFAWRYTRQLKDRQPIYFRNLAVMNTITGQVYDSIIDAGMVEGLLFEDVWRSTYTKEAVFPNGSIFEVVERV